MYFHYHFHVNHIPLRIKPTLFRAKLIIEMTPNILALFNQRTAQWRPEEKSFKSILRNNMQPIAT